MLKAVSAAIGISASFVVGTIYEKGWNIDRIQKKPGIPLFGTVSVANLASDRIQKPGIPLFGTVSVANLSNIRKYGDFVLSYDTRNKSAHWIFEHLTFESVADTA